jgi:integrase
LSEEELTDIIESGENPEAKAFLALLALSGARRGELLMLKRKDLWVDDNSKFLWVRFHTLKDRANKVVAVERHNYFLISNPKTQFIIDYARSVEDKERRLFEFGNWKAREIVKHGCPTAWLHLFRHTRATRLAEKGATEQQLCTWFGWVHADTASIYVNRSPTMIKGVGELIE